jgi:competence protein ComEC
VNTPLSYPLIKTALAVAIGILLQQYSTATISWTFLIWGSTLLFLVLLFLRKWNKGLYVIESIAIWILFIGCGAQASNGVTPKSYHPKEGEISGTFYCENVQLKEKLIVAEGWLVDSMGQFRAKVICFTTRPDTISLKTGRTHLFTGKLNSFQPPKNPFEFDQKRFNEAKGFIAQVILSEIQLLNNVGLSSLKQTSHAWIQHQFAQIKNPEVNGLLVAFTTGDKRMLSTATKNAFSRAGVMHLLAVSGLHVSLVAGLPLLLLKRSRKKTIRLFWFCSALTIVWLYAWLTGFQASVLRAATMLSLIGLAQVLQVTTSSINQLGAAGTFILLAEPNALFSVGFQLSFAAVGAILMWAPILSKLFRTQHLQVNKIVNGACVSTAAQAGSSPLSIYYFHNFPLLFLPANLIAIPLATVILYGALVLLLLGSFGIEFEWIFLLVEWLGGALILLATWTSDIWFSSAEGLSLSTFEVIVLYTFLLAFFHVLGTQRKRRSYKVSILALAMLLTCVIMRRTPFLELTVFTGSKNLVLGIRNEREALLVVSGKYRNGAVSGWVKRYGANVIELKADTLIRSPFLVWKREAEWGIEHLVISELMEQKKTVDWDGIIVRKTRTYEGWSALMPCANAVTDTVLQYGNASTYLFNSNGLPVATHGQHSLPIAKDRSEEE